ncbi:tRNA pseudouridine(38-40) synthase TruA [Gemmatimonas aurantiaca]|nr:tRNA pseudouridine(38-40) synthase TruA [Gemmatimonas aurantiaca]
MTNIKLLIEFDGTNYCGWQRQNGQPSVQETIETALAKLLGAPTTLYGAGRTDSGVHALGQVANFRSDSTIPHEKFAPALQQHLPDDILIKESCAVAENFESRFDAVARTYRYRIAWENSALERNRRWNLRTQPALGALEEAAELFFGDMDCSALCIPNSLQKNNRCTITHSKWLLAGDEFHYTITGNRFLHSMVRAIVGFCIKHAQNLAEDAPENGLTVGRIRDILDEGKWTTDHYIAPPQGLYLIEVTY